MCLCVFRRGKFMKCQLRYNGGNVTCLLFSNSVASGNSFLAITPQCTAVTRNVASHVCQCFTQWCKIFASEVLPEEPAADVPWYFHAPSFYSLLALWYFVIMRVSKTLIVVLLQWHGLPHLWQHGFSIFGTHVCFYTHYNDGAKNTFIWKFSFAT